MKTLLAAILFIGLCVLGMCFNIIFRKNGQFPQTEIGDNENMKKMGIKCMKEQEAELFNDGDCGSSDNSSCGGCSFHG